MKRYRFRKLDAFTSGASSGNPAGWIELADRDDIEPAAMQRIAAGLTRR